MADRYLCRVCLKTITATKNDRYRSHTGGDGEPCPSSSCGIPEDLLEGGPAGGPDDVPREGQDFATCPQCARKVKLTKLGYFEPHDETLRGGDRCPVSGVRAKHARSIDDRLLPGDEKASPSPKVRDSDPTSAAEGATPIPDVPTGHPEPTWREGGQIDWSKVGDLKHLPESAPDANSSASTEASSPASSTTSTSSKRPASPSTESTATSSDARGGTEGSADAGPFHLAPLLDDVILQPFSHILQPALYAGAVKVVMGDLAKELATKIKETFYAYSNRKTSDNRSAQTTLGPSEIGTPCDRRLAMALLGVRPVNPGGDGWAAFVGTCTHAGMAEVYTFADAGTGRYAVELPVFLGMPTVPRGTTDLLDRRDGTIIDWKVMGKYSLDKFKKEGPSDTYRVQAHVYGLGAERGGEKVRNVAIVGLPRAGSSLDEMHIWSEPYDRKLAQDALARVERIANDVQTLEAEQSTWAGLDIAAGRMRNARSFETGDDCRFCEFHLEGDRDMRRGCPGK